MAHLFGGYILFAKDLVDRCFVDVNVDSGQRKGVVSEVTERMPNLLYDALLGFKGERFHKLLKVTRSLRITVTTSPYAQRPLGP